MLTDGSFKKRYTGGEAVIDINGKLHMTKSEFKKYQLAEAAAGVRYKKSLGYVAKKPRKTDQSKAGQQIERKVINKDNEKKQYVINATEITTRVNAMVAASVNAIGNKTYLGMLTVSFPECVTEDIAAQALNTFLTALRENGKRKIRDYLRVSEKQKNGTIHYHILICNRVNIVKVNRAMRVVLCSLVRDGVLNWSLSAAKRYNGVDLAKDRVTRQITNFAEPRKRKALTSYITKYVSKNKEKFSHTAWHCSRGFSALFTGITCTNLELIKKDWGLLAHENPAIVTKWFLFFPWLSGGPPDQFIMHLSQLNSYILQARQFLN